MKADGDQERKCTIINQSPLQHRPITHDPVTTWQKESSTEAWPQHPNGHNSPGNMHLPSLSSWEKRLTKAWAREEKKKCAQSILYLSTWGWHRGDLLYWNGTGVGRGSCWKERRMQRIKVRQTTQNFFLLNFNLLDKNNSKWGTEYAWGLEGILSFSGDSSLNGIANYVSHCSVQFS